MGGKEKKEECSISSKFVLPLYQTVISGKCRSPSLEFRFKVWQKAPSSAQGVASQFGSLAQQAVRANDVGCDRNGVVTSDVGMSSTGRPVGSLFGAISMFHWSLGGGFVSSTDHHR